MVAHSFGEGTWVAPIPRICCSTLILTSGERPDIVKYTPCDGKGRKGMERDGKGWKGMEREGKGRKGKEREGKGWKGMKRDGNGARYEMVWDVR